MLPLLHRVTTPRSRAARLATVDTMQGAMLPRARPAPGRACKAAEASTSQPSRNVIAYAHGSRRELLAAGAVLLAGASSSGEAHAVQGLTAGRIPGLGPDPEMEGMNLYQRPAGKSGGHGVGWSEIPKVRAREPARTTPWSIEVVAVAWQV